jgi:type I restriction enzyme M protein
VLDPANGTGGFTTAVIEHLKKQAKNVKDRKSIEQNVAGWEYKPLPYLLATTNFILHDIEVPNITFRDALDKPLSAYTEKDRVDIIWIFRSNSPLKIAQYSPLTLNCHLI